MNHSKRTQTLLLPAVRSSRTNKSKAIQIRSCRTVARKESFFPRTIIREWNSLPTSSVERMSENTSDEEPELDVPQREWNKVRRERLVSGYRDGLSDGQDKVLQAAFNRGYCTAMRDSYRLAHLRGMLTAALGTELLLGEGSTISAELQQHTENLIEKIFQAENSILENTSGIIHNDQSETKDKQETQAINAGGCDSTDQSSDSVYDCVCGRTQGCCQSEDLDCDTQDIHRDKSDSDIKSICYAKECDTKKDADADNMNYSLLDSKTENVYSSYLSFKNECRLLLQQFKLELQEINV